MQGGSLLGTYEQADDEPVLGDVQLCVPRGACCGRDCAIRGPRAPVAIVEHAQFGDEAHGRDVVFDARSDELADERPAGDGDAERIGATSSWHRCPKSR